MENWIERNGYLFSTQGRIIQLNNTRTGGKFIKADKELIKLLRG